VRVGLYFDLRDPQPDAMGPGRRPGHALELAEEADRRGIDSLWLSEHHFFDDGYLSQPLVFAAALAARTKRARIGTAVLLAPLRDATTIAEEAALVDAISDGRLELGLGAGYRIPEFEAFGAEVRRRFPLLEERARQVRDLWADPRITPRPVQADVPLWIGSHGPRGAELAGRLGAGLLALRPQHWPAYRDAYLASGLPGAPRASGPLSLVLCDDPERTWAAIRPFAERHWAVYDHYAREGRTGAGDVALPAVFDTLDGGRTPPVRAVTVEQAITEIRAIQAQMPVEHVFLWERVSGMPEDISQRHVELVTSELRPALAGDA
jgi:alkanesulfonate monooxygenase SsuD/methylene tetrahydromethanopterin reductase-like flavin-dependent oxidoreductase (luciferase family)